MTRTKTKTRKWKTQGEKIRTRDKQIGHETRNNEKGTKTRNMEQELIEISKEYCKTNDKKAMCKDKGQEQWTRTREKNKGQEQGTRTRVQEQGTIKSHKC